MEIVNKLLCPYRQIRFAAMAGCGPSCSTHVTFRSPNSSTTHLPTRLCWPISIA